MTIRIHDYRNRCWGHDYSLTPDPDPVTARITGWGPHLRVGDLLVIPRPGEDTGAALYLVESRRWADGVDDMWFAACRFTPASSELGRRALEAMTRPMAYAPADPLSGWWEL